MNKSEKLNIISIIIQKLNHLKDRIKDAHDQQELLGREIKMIVDIHEDIGKLELLTDNILFDKLKNNYPNNEVIQRYIEELQTP